MSTNSTHTHSGAQVNSAFEQEIDTAYLTAIGAKDPEVRAAAMRHMVRLIGERNARRTDAEIARLESLRGLR